MENLSSIQAVNFSNPLENVQAQGLQKSKKPNDTEFAAAMGQFAILSQPTVNQNVPSQPFGETNVEPKTEEVKQNVSNQEQKKWADISSLAGQGQNSQINTLDGKGFLQIQKQEIPSEKKVIESKLEGLNLLKASPKGKEDLDLTQLQLKAPIQKITSTQGNELTFAGLKSMNQDLDHLEKINFQNDSKLLDALNLQSKAHLDNIIQSSTLQANAMNDSILKGTRGEVVQESVLGQQIPELNKSYNKTHSDLSNQKPIQTDLSGAEFLSTLNVVRGNVDPKKSGSNLGDSGSNQDGKLGKQFEFKNDPKIDKKARELTSRDDGSFSQLTLNHSVNSIGGGAKPMTEVSAQVVPGAMSQNRLSTDALVGVSGGIRNLSSSGGGEMRIRLRPDNLGELSVRVMTHGNRVGLQIQASDEKAKKILEDSIQYLKESLSAHNLSLSQVDFSVNSSTNLSSGNDQGQDSRQSQGSLSHQGDFTQNKNQGGNQRHSDQWFGGESNLETRSLNGRPAAGLASMKNWGSDSQDRNQVVNGRLDIKA